MIGLTSSVRDIAEKMAPSANVRRVKLETAAAHALRMQEVSMEVEVVRAELKHVPILLPLFDQYRSFFAQPSELDQLEEFLRERITKGQTAIFIALPLHPADAGKSGAPAAAAAGGRGGGAPVPDDPAMSAHEQQLASSMVTSHSVSAGVAHTNTHGGAARTNAPGRLPSYALGFVQLVPSWSTVQLARTWDVADLFVAPAARNKGVASLLLTHAKKFGVDTHATSLNIYTAVHNTHMQRMFSRLELHKQPEHATFIGTLS